MFIREKSCQSAANPATTLERDRQKWKPVCVRFVQCELFCFCKYHLADVDISGQKSGFAIGEVVFSEPPEPIVEAERRQVRPGGAEVISPRSKGLGIILPENALANNGDTEALAE